MLGFVMVSGMMAPSLAQIVPLPHAHAHNDYYHSRPLLDALSHGFTSIEADVLLIDGELYVGHDMPQGAHDLPTLREAYLEPLARIVHNHRGEVYPDFGGEFYLMIDIKTEAEATYEVLNEQLADFEHILSRSENGSFTPGAVTVFLSGNRPMATLRQANSRLVGLDGRPENLGEGYSAELMPVISENYSKVIRWDGVGDISKADFQKLTELTTRAHAEGKKVRLWASPDHPNAWSTLKEAGIDLINTDDLPGLKAFLLEDYASH
jgi:hypothetical protein